MKVLPAEKGNSQTINCLKLHSVSQSLFHMGKYFATAIKWHTEDQWLSIKV